MISRKVIFKELRILFLWYLATALLILGLLYYVVTQNSFESEIDSNLDTWLSLVRVLSGFAVAYLVAFAPYLLFIIIRSLVRDSRKRGFKGFVKGSLLKVIMPISLIWISLQFIDDYRFSERFDYQWDRTVENRGDTIRNFYAQDQKQRGIHIFNILEDAADLDTLKRNNFEWITLTPFIAQDEYNKPTLRGDFIENDSAPSFTEFRKAKELIDQYQFKVMLKPHVWLMNTSGGVWRSDIEMQSEEDWKKWFDSYEKAMLAYARIAEELQMEIFCIGTELYTPAMQKPERWRSFIKKIRKVYSGNLTYGANWDAEVKELPFWDALDFIGVQAYFPIAQNHSPRLEELEEGWKKHYSLLQGLSEKHDKPILFTELGYKTTTDAGITPWEWNNVQNRFYKRVSKRTQALCYQAFFNTVWQQDWFAGVHIWEWQSRGTSQGNNNAFTLQGKPALNVVARGFAEQAPK